MAKCWHLQGTPEKGVLMPSSVHRGAASAVLANARTAQFFRVIPSIDALDSFSAQMLSDCMGDWAFGEALRGLWLLRTTTPCPHHQFLVPLAPCRASLEGRGLQAIQHAMQEESLMQVAPPPSRPPNPMPSGWGIVTIIHKITYRYLCPLDRTQVMRPALPSMCPQPLTCNQTTVWLGHGSFFTFVTLPRKARLWHPPADTIVHWRCPHRGRHPVAGV